MLSLALVVARKEIVDGLRDFRSVLSSALYALMGPVVVGLVSLSSAVHSKDGSGAAVLVGMMSVFVLVAAFVGGMNVAMDTIAGERERRSLLPLLLNPVPRLDIVLGKWLAVSLFAIGGLVLDLAGFAVVFRAASLHAAPWQRTLAALALGVLPLALLAASAQLLLSTICRAVKEAQTYLSLIVFLPMGIGMSMIFLPATGVWREFVPLMGQQLELQRILNGAAVPLIRSVTVGYFTVVLALLFLWMAANRLRRDEIVYGS